MFNLQKQKSNIQALQNNNLTLKSIGLKKSPTQRWVFFYLHNIVIKSGGMLSGLTTFAFFKSLMKSSFLYSAEGESFLFKTY